MMTSTCNCCMVNQPLSTTPTHPHHSFQGGMCFHCFPLITNCPTSWHVMMCSPLLTLGIPNHDTIDELTESAHLLKRRICHYKFQMMKWKSVGIAVQKDLDSATWKLQQLPKHCSTKQSKNKNTINDTGLLRCTAHVVTATESYKEKLSSFSTLCSDSMVCICETIAVSLFDCNIWDGHWVDAFVSVVKKHLQTHVFSLENVLHEMDLSGVLNYEGLKVLYTCEARGHR